MKTAIATAVGVSVAMIALRVIGNQETASVVLAVLFGIWR